jgi:hypothetical protein
MNIRAAMEYSLKHGKVVCVVVPDVDIALRQIRRIWGGKANHVVTDAGTEVWGWTRTTPKNNHDFRLLLKTD